MIKISGFTWLRSKGRSIKRSDIVWLSKTSYIAGVKNLRRVRKAIREIEKNDNKKP